MLPGYPTQNRKKRGAKALRRKQCDGAGDPSLRCSILVAGGFGVHGRLHDSDVPNGAAPGVAMAGAVGETGAGAGAGGKRRAVAAASAAGRVRTECWMLAGQRWLKVEPLPEPLYCAGSALLGDQTVLFGPSAH